MRQPTFYAAVFGIIRNEEGKILFSRRYNTGHLDGYLSLPAGHVEEGEPLTDAMIRELSEELNISHAQLYVSHTQQSKSKEDTKVYFNAYFEIDFFDGAIKNQEPDKCSELIFLSLDELKDQKVVPYVHHALDCIRDGKIFSEIRWSNTHDS